MSEKECSGCFKEHKERVRENCRRLKAPLAEGPAYFVVCGCCGRFRTWARPGDLVRKGSPQVLSQENGAGGLGGEESGTGCGDHSRRWLSMGTGLMRKVFKGSGLFSL